VVAWHERHLYLIRHGQSEGNAQGIIQGWLDFPLSERGSQQARRLAERMASSPLDRIYASDLRRAAETAQIIATTTGAPVILCPWLREMNAGILSGLTAEDLHQQHADFLKLPREKRGGFPNGESYQEFYTRVTTGLEAILSNNDDPARSIAIVAHGGSLDVIVAYLLRLDYPAYGRFVFDEASLTKIRFKPVADEYLGQVEFLNDTHHWKDHL
jgi:broad specificity phosphatase PhoE